MLELERSSYPIEQCKRCSSRTVQVIAERKERDGTWTMELHCPQCGSIRCATFLSETRSGYRRRAKSYRKEIEVSANRWSMFAFEDIFIRALAADAIWPMDFGSP
jgi:uncharacterized Zn finger protein